jgi:aryl-alcohol dehydrogenase-like predicted oxidoreductase
MTQLGLGTASFIDGYGLGPNPTVDAERLIRTAVERGIGYIDTAAGYGASEEIIGRFSTFLQQKGVRIATKLPKDGLHRLDESLQRLRTSRIDTLLVHSADETDIATQSVGDMLLDAKMRGLVGRTGASTYGSAAAGAALAEEWCDVVQVEHSIVNPSVMATLGQVRRPGQEVVVRSVLCKGLLTGRRAQFAGLPPIGMEVLDRLEERAASWGYTVPELAIRFALDTPGVDVVVVGVSSDQELELALRATNRRLDPAQWKSLAEFNSHEAYWAHPERWVEV